MENKMIRLNMINENSGEIRQKDFYGKDVWVPKDIKSWIKYRVKSWSSFLLQLEFGYGYTKEEGLTYLDKVFGNDHGFNTFSVSRNFTDLNECVKIIEQLRKDVA